MKWLSALLMLSFSLASWDSAAAELRVALYSATTNAPAEAQERAVALLEVLNAQVLWASTTTGDVLAVVDESVVGLLEATLNERVPRQDAVPVTQFGCNGWPPECEALPGRVVALVDAQEASNIQAFVEAAGGSLVVGGGGGPQFEQIYEAPVDLFGDLEGRDGVISLRLEEVGGPGVPQPQPLFLGEGNRFWAFATFLVDGSLRQSAPQRLAADSGAFWFFEPDNLELSLKVLDACSFDGHFWIFVAGTTDLGVDITIRDSVTTQMSQYSNPAGELFRSVRDFRSLPCN